MTYTENLTYEEFIANSKTIDAVIRNYEIIGDAANRLPESIKDSMNSIDWFRIRGFRNRVAHQYFGIDYEIVWLLRDTYLIGTHIQNRRFTKYIIIDNNLCHYSIR